MVEKVILVTDYWWTLQVLFCWDQHCAKNSYKWRWRQDSRFQLWEMVRDRETWRAAVYGVTRSQTWLGNWTTTAVGEVRLPRAKRCQDTYWDIDCCLILSLGHYISLFNRAFGQGEWGVRIGLCPLVATSRRLQTETHRKFIYIHFFYIFVLEKSVETTIFLLGRNNLLWPSNPLFFSVFLAPRIPQCCPLCI